MISDTEVRVSLDTLGCKLNQAETEALARELAGAGFRIVGPSAKAEVYILNTCTVTHIADSKARHLLRLARRRNPKALVIATGCYASRKGNNLEDIEGVKIIPIDGDKSVLVKRLRKLLKGPASPQIIERDVHRKRSFVKIQQGCTNFCSYCIVPSVRGTEKSVPADEIMADLKAREADGIQEIILTGTRIGVYGDAGLNLAGLLGRVLAETNIPRIRLSSLQPQEITPDLLPLWQDSRLCPHFHLALQSGCDSVLSRMKRRYDTADFAEAVEAIRKVVPDAAITTDIIVGFPAETEEEFRRSYEFCRHMEFAQIHVFPYSMRENTAASLIKPACSDNVKQLRADIMLGLSAESAERFKLGFIGRTMPVLFETAKYTEWTGLTGNYIRVHARSSEDLTNKVMQVRMRKMGNGGAICGDIITVSQL